MSPAMLRNLVITLSLALAGAGAMSLSACGPSAKEFAVAKSARYKGDKLAIFNAAKAAAEEKYKLAKVDETSLGFQTVGKWYTPEGLVAERQDDMRMVPDRSLNIVLVVTLVPDGDLWVVKVEPVMLRYFAGRPNPDKLEPKDPSVPGWANDRVDSLQFDIYTALKPYEVKSTANGIQSPPPAGSAAPTPAPTPAPAGSGSAAPAPAAS